MEDQAGPDRITLLASRHVAIISLRSLLTNSRPGECLDRQDDGQSEWPCQNAMHEVMRW